MDTQGIDISNWFEKRWSDIESAWLTNLDTWPRLVVTLIGVLAVFKYVDSGYSFETRFKPVNTSLNFILPIARPAALLAAAWLVWTIYSSLFGLSNNFFQATMPTMADLPARVRQEGLPIVLAIVGFIVGFIHGYKTPGLVRGLVMGSLTFIGFNLFGYLLGYFF